MNERNRIKDEENPKFRLKSTDFVKGTLKKYDEFRYW